MSKIHVSKTVFIHFCLQIGGTDRVPNIAALALDKDMSKDWAEYWEKHHGKLLHVAGVTETFEMDDPAQVEIELLKAEIKAVQGKAAMRVKSYNDRINYLLMIGYGGDQVREIPDTDTAVEVKDVTDLMAARYDADKGSDFFHF